MKNKLKQIFTGSILMLPFFMNVVSAEEPSFNIDAAKSLVSSWADPAASFLLWAIPVIGAVVLLITGVLWFSKDEEEKEQKPFKKRGILIFKIIIVLELIPTIYKIFNLS